MIEQNYSNNDRLAEVYQKEVRQIIVVFPILWKHMPNGNWFISHIFNL